MKPEEKARINPGLSAVLSFLFSGLGQIYNGQISKGLTLMGLSAIGMILLIVGLVQTAYCVLSGMGDLTIILIGGLLALAGIIVIMITGIYNIYDAYNVSRKKLEG